MPGYSGLGLWPTRDSIVFVPDDYDAIRPAALLIMLHGAGGSAQSWLRMPFDQLVRGRNVVVLLVSSGGSTWEPTANGAGSDVARLDASLTAVYEQCVIDSANLIIAGFSDGASYGISVGLANGDMFSWVIGFSPGYITAPVPRGEPRIYVAHGVNDSVLPISETSRQLVPLLRRSGYEVEYVEFDGGHEVTYDEAERAMDWCRPRASARGLTQRGADQ